MRLIDLPDTIDLAFDKTELVKDGRDEPLFPVVAGADLPEAKRLDPTRLDLDPETAPPGRSVWRGSIGSLLLHLLPLLALIGWLRPPLEIPKPIPVQLVIEQPPPPPPAKAPPRDRPPPGLRASEDFGEVGPPSAHKGADTAPPTKGEAPPPVAQAPTAPSPPEPPVEPSQRPSPNRFDAAPAAGRTPSQRPSPDRFGATRAAGRTPQGSADNDPACSSQKPIPP